MPSVWQNAIKTQQEIDSKRNNFFYESQGTVLNEHKYQLIRSKFQHASILKMVSSKVSFDDLCSLILHQDE